MKKILYILLFLPGFVFGQTYYGDNGLEVQTDSTSVKGDLNVVTEVNINKTSSGDSTLNVGGGASITGGISVDGTSLNVNNSSNNVCVGCINGRTALEIQKSNTGNIEPILTMINQGGTGAGVAIDMAGYDYTTNDAASRFASIDAENFSSNLLFQTKVPGANGNSLTTRVQINSSGELIIMGCIKADTGDPASPVEGQITINTFDNAIKIYADGAWRTLVTW